MLRKTELKGERKTGSRMDLVETDNRNRLAVCIRTVRLFSPDTAAIWQTVKTGGFTFIKYFFKRM